MMALATHLQHIEAEKQKLKSQVKRLCQENAWLRDELNSVQQQQQMLGQQVAQLEEENKHLEFMMSIKKFDEDQQQEPGGQQQLEQRPENHSATLQELGFGPEDEDDLQASSNNFSAIQPTPPNVMAASASGGYEIPHRLRTLHNLVSLSTSHPLPTCYYALKSSCSSRLRSSNTRTKAGTRWPSLCASRRWRTWRRAAGTTTRTSPPCSTSSRSSTGQCFVGG